MKDETFSLSAEESNVLAGWVASSDDLDLKFLEDGNGGYVSMRECEEHIRSGTELGRKLLRMIMNLVSQKKKDEHS